MKTLHLVAHAITAMTVSTGAGPAVALEKHTFVSALNGTDANVPCPRATPCRSLNTAIENTEAGGTVTMLDDGTYPPALIGKHLTIEGQGTGTRILNPGAAGIATVQNVRAVLRNFSVDGGFGTPGWIGIFAATRTAVSVENVTISNQLASSAAGIFVDFEAEVHLKNVSIGNSGSSGTGGAVVIDTVSSYSSRVHIDNSAIDHNWRGIVLSGNGNTRLSIGNSAVVNTMGTSAVSIQTSGGTHKIDINDSKIANSAGTGIRIAQTAGNVQLSLSDTTVSNSVGDGIYVGPSGGTTKLDPQNSKVANNGGTGVLIAPTGSAKVNTTIMGSGMDGNVIGIRSFPGGSAISNVTVSDTSTSNNAGGIHASGKSTVSIIRSAVGGNSSYGVGAVSPAAVRIGSSVVSGNTLGFSGPISSYGNNQLHGNGAPGSSTPLPPGSVP